MITTTIKSTLLLAGLTVSLSDSSINIVVVGDWGGIPFPPYSTPGQKAAADGMANIAQQINASAIFALGDNFYFDGIRGDATGHRFEDTWNSVYSQDSLQVPWYLLAGNHDHYGNVSAEVAFTEISDRWNFPNLYHTQSFKSEDGTTMDVVFIDTVDLAGNSEIQDENDPRYYDKLPYRPRSAAAEQWSWIEAQLQASTADYLFVAGHYPIYSLCSHGNTENLIENLRPMLIQYGAHYMAGHDHCMVSTRDENDIMYIVTGIGNTCCTKSEHMDDVPTDYLQWYLSKDNRKDIGEHIIGGFSSVTATSSGLSVAFYDQDANLLYTAPSVPPRMVNKQ
eukprot:CAMPEP_0185025580 /NCGR_PEP_ID=MMETSP1103-20130426/8478_1 /TAXON_ID=36769 /ORGANISM="Paraphysomonas bandaiensis, Strain Caron Lab Isolate" /LENGTH=336 /DNA_ID=CAMNT_0027558807 /DNA_START=31 /DNA_END=1041 /DNA_ORIENTATION=+